MLKRFATIFSVVIVLLLLPLGLVSSLRTTAVRIVRPLAAPLIRNNTHILETFRTIRQIPVLRSDTQKLQEQNLVLAQKLIGYQDVIRENQTLRTELGVTGVARTYKKVFARIVVRGLSTVDQTFTVDIGTGSGIRIGQPAVSHGALVGKVISADANSAVIRTIISRESRIQARVSESREKGLLIGDGSNTFLSDVTQGVTVMQDSVVETSGLGGSLPQGIIIGQIGTGMSQKSDLSQKFLINVSQDPNSLESVFILLTDAP
jgi:rod shape-determining protein MreC